MHAITGESWLVKLKFRTAKKSFRAEDLEARFDLKPLNQMDDLPIYGNDSRVRCKTARGPWQEIEFKLHSWEETNTPEFWEFLETAVRGFEGVVNHVAANPEDIMPWKKLGQKWHLSRRGFPPGKRVAWEPSLLEDLCALLAEVAGARMEFLWNNQQLVHLFVVGQKQPWATLVTKRPDSLDLALTGPKSMFGLGRITELGHNPQLDGQHTDHDVMRLSFRNNNDLDKGNLHGFLQEHVQGVRGGATT